jgi:hypothetical protein
VKQAMRRLDNICKVPGRREYRLDEQVQTRLRQSSVSVANSPQSWNEKGLTCLSIFLAMQGSCGWPGTLHAGRIRVGVLGTVL